MPMLHSPTWSCRRLEVLDLLDLSTPDERRVGPSTKGRAVGPDVEEVASVDDPGDLGPGSLSNPVEPRVLDVSASRTPLPGVLETLLPDGGDDPGASVMVRDGVDTLTVRWGRGVAQVPLPLGFSGGGGGRSDPG